MSPPADDPPSAPLAVCPVCHQAVPEQNMTSLSGRRMCLACAAAWFDDEGDQDDD